MAVGHSILSFGWHLLPSGETYSDLGGDYFDKRKTSTAHQRRLVAQLEAMGHKVTLEPAAWPLTASPRPNSVLPRPRGNARG